MKVLRTKLTDEEYEALRAIVGRRGISAYAWFQEKIREGLAKDSDPDVAEVMKRIHDQRERLETLESERKTAIAKAAKRTEGMLSLTNPWALAEADYVASGRTAHGDRENLAWITTKRATWGLANVKPEAILARISEGGKGSRGTGSTPTPTPTRPSSLPTPPTEAAPPSPGALSKEATRKVDPQGRPVESTGVVDPAGGLSEGSTREVDSHGGPHSGPTRIPFVDQVFAYLNLKQLALVEDVVSHFNARDIPAVTVEAAIEQLREQGRIESPSDGIYRVADERSRPGGAR